MHAVLEALGRGGGYIFAAAHNLQDDVPPENIVAMFEAAGKWQAVKPVQITPAVSLETAGVLLILGAGAPGRKRPARQSSNRNT